MRKFYNILFLFLVFLQSTIAISQIKSFGVPFIVNHSRSTYNASTQNWSITQSRKGFIYIGNNDGILEFDGTTWKLFPVPNSSVIRSVYAKGDTIYAGAFEEMGFLAPNSKGQLVYNSLTHLIPKEYSGFDEIWNIFEQQGKIIFQSFNYIFIYHNGEVKVIKPLSKFSMLHKVNEDFYIVDIENGLMQLKDDSLQFVSDNPIFFRNEIRCFLPLSNSEVLIGTSNDGLFIFNGDVILPWKSDVNSRIIEHNLFSALLLSDGNMAFGTVSNGLYISNKKGEILQHLNRYIGLQNNTILSLFEDKKNNLWLGLDNGVDFLEVSSPLTFLNYNFNIESAYCSTVHNGIMYVGTNQGLYAAKFDEISKFSSNSQKFKLIKGTEGQVWGISIIDNTLFCGHNFGCYVVEKFTAQQISDIRGFWSFVKPNEISNTIIAGTYTGLVRLVKENGSWVYKNHVYGFNESSRNMFLDQNNTIWISHGYRGLFKLTMNKSFDTVTNYKLFWNDSGLPPELPYNIQAINNQMYVSTQAGILRYNNFTETFEKATEINSLFDENTFIDKIHQDDNGNLWYFTDTYMGIVRLLEDGTYRNIKSPFSGINDILLPSFQNIFIYDNYNVFIGSQKGLIHYSPNIIKDYNVADEVYIKEASFYGKDELVSFSFMDGISRFADLNPISIPYRSNSVTFKYTTPAFENPEDIYFSFRLSGFDNRWSVWDKINFKEYTNLREGNYTFQVRARNAFGAVSEIKSFHFSIQPPFLRSKVAYGVYLTLLVLIIVGNIIYIRRRLLKIRQREKMRHEKRLAKREQMFQEQSALSEKEIIKLRNESLRNEMRFKNKELANATLHLIQKNKTLTYLKDDLTKVLKTIPSENPDKQSINNLLKKINRDLKNEKNWELFNTYFDEVHEDFMERLKQEYSDLTPKDLRLCAYLRMNISTKEIAPLMNISIRGVEISRYRLRKKLKLDYNTNLTDFIISF